MEPVCCPRCNSEDSTKSGIVNNRQRYRCKRCGYHYTVGKLGKRIESYYVIKALQLYLEGISLREIERILGISHTTVANWVRLYGIRQPLSLEYKPTYKIITHDELVNLIKDKSFIHEAGLILTPVADKYMLIRWERFGS
jgi:transposase-like protein